MKNTALWQLILSSLEKKISRPSFVTWFQKTSIKQKKGEKITISVPNIFVREWLQNKFETKLLSSIQQFSPEVKKIKYTIHSSTSQSLNAKTTLSSIRNKRQETKGNKKTDHSQHKIEFYQNRLSGLNPKYTFENFVVGSFNQLAHACAVSITKKFKSGSKKQEGRIKTEYNPLFIYSNVGLGKTHLLEAIGNEIINSSKRKKVKYIPCSNFTSQVIASIRDQSIEKIVQDYNHFHVLIIDDIEFIAGKERTQEVFFRIFNDLSEKGKQIILSSDRPPRAIENLEERLRSRFGGGMIADISPTSFEERMAILEQKLEERKSSIPEDILEFIAKNVKSNIRELEGVLIKALIMSEEEQSLNNIKQELKDIVEEPRKRISPEKIIKTVCNFYNITKKEILGKSRKKEIVLPRQTTMYLLREELDLSFPSIAVKIGNKDHTTVEYSCGRIVEKLRKERDFIKDIEVIRERAYNN